MATSGAGGKSAAPANTVRRYTIEQLMEYRTKYLAPSEDIFEALRSAELEFSHAQDTLVLPEPVARPPSQRRENHRASKQDRSATGSRDRGHSNKQLNDADPEWMHFPVGDKPASAPDAITGRKPSSEMLLPSYLKPAIKPTSTAVDDDKRKSEQKGTRPAAPTKTAPRAQQATVLQPASSLAELVGAVPRKQAAPARTAAAAPVKKPSKDGDIDVQMAALALDASSLSVPWMQEVALAPSASEEDDEVVMPMSGRSRFSKMFGAADDQTSAADAAPLPAARAAVASAPRKQSDMDLLSLMGSASAQPTDVSQLAQLEQQLLHTPTRSRQPAQGAARSPIPQPALDASSASAAPFMSDPEHLVQMILGDADASAPTYMRRPMEQAPPPMQQMMRPPQAPMMTVPSVRPPLDYHGQPMLPMPQFMAPQQVRPRPMQMPPRPLPHVMPPQPPMQSANYGVSYGQLPPGLPQQQQHQPGQQDIMGMLFAAAAGQSHGYGGAQPLQPQMPMPRPALHQSAAMPDTARPAQLAAMRPMAPTAARPAAGLEQARQADAEGAELLQRLLGNVAATPQAPMPVRPMVRPQASRPPGATDQDEIMAELLRGK